MSRAILHRLGTNAEIAERLGVDHSTVWRWAEYGVPPDRWLELIELGRRLRPPVHLILDDFAPPRLRATARNKAEVS
jgi:hypothetical protein